MGYHEYLLLEGTLHGIPFDFLKEIEDFDKLALVVQFGMKREQEKRKNEIKELDTLNHIAGNYTAHGVNAPKKYPKKPYLIDMDKPELDIVNNGEDMLKWLKESGHMIVKKKGG